MQIQNILLFYNWKLQFFLNISIFWLKNAIFSTFVLNPNNHDYLYGDWIFILSFKQSINLFQGQTWRMKERLTSMATLLVLIIMTWNSGRYQKEKFSIWILLWFLIIIIFIIILGLTLWIKVMTKIWSLRKKWRKMTLSRSFMLSMRQELWRNRRCWVSALHLDTR